MEPWSLRDEWCNVSAACGIPANLCKHISTNRCGSVSCLLPVKAPSTETAVPAQATAHAWPPVAAAWVGGMRYDAERQAQGKLLLREYVLKTLKDLIPHYPPKSLQFVLCI